MLQGACLKRVVHLRVIACLKIVQQGFISTGPTSSSIDICQAYMQANKADGI